MTYNVEKFDKGGDIPSGTYAAIANTVKTNSTDIINLCEVESSGNDETSFSSALTTAGWAMNYHAFSSMSDDYNSIGHFSRYPVSEVSEILASSGINPNFWTQENASDTMSLETFDGNQKEKTVHRRIQKRCT